MKRILSFILIVLAGIPSFADAAVQEESPRAAVVISRTSYSARENEVSGAAKSWTAIAGLAGIPYSTLFVEDLADGSLTDGFDVFVLSQCTFLTDSEYDIVSKFVDRISGTGAGLLATYILLRRMIRFGSLSTIVSPGPLTCDPYFMFVLTISGQPCLNSSAQPLDRTSWMYFG